MLITRIYLKREQNLQIFSFKWNIFPFSYHMLYLCSVIKIFLISGILLLLYSPKEDVLQDRRPPT